MQLHFVRFFTSMQDARRRLQIEKARAFVQRGSPTEALEVTLQLLRDVHHGDERAVFNTIREAREQHISQQQQNKQQEKRFFDGLMHENQIETLACTLEGQPSREGPVLMEGDPSRMQVLRDAFVDGSSCVCSRCGAFVPVARLQHHMEFWCEAADNKPGGSDEEDNLTTSTSSSTSHSQPGCYSTAPTTTSDQDVDMG